MITTKQAIGLVAANFVMGMSLVVGDLTLPTGVHVVGTAHAATCQEDDPDHCWDCRRDGDRVCGPGNDQGVLAGCYSDTSPAAPLAPWPCHVIVRPDGEGDIYTGMVDPLLPTRVLIGPAFEALPNGLVS